MSSAEFELFGCFMCGKEVCGCECLQSPLCGCGKRSCEGWQSMILLDNKKLTEMLQAIRAEVTGLRRENRELHKQAETREIENAALKAALKAALAE